MGLAYVANAIVTPCGLVTQADSGISWQMDMTNLTGGSVNIVNVNMSGVIRSNLRCNMINITEGIIVMLGDICLIAIQI